MANADELRIAVVSIERRAGLEAQVAVEVCAPIAVCSNWRSASETRRRQLARSVLADAAASGFPLVRGQRAQCRPSVDAARCIRPRKGR